MINTFLINYIIINSSTLYDDDLQSSYKSLIHLISKTTNIPIVNNLLYIEEESLKKIIDTIPCYSYLCLFNLTKLTCNIIIENHESISIETLIFIEKFNQNSPYIEKIKLLILIKKLQGD